MIPYAEPSSKSLLNESESYVCWSDRHSFYERFGFKAWSTEFYLSYTNAFTDNPIQISCSLKRGFNSQIPSLFEKNSESNLVRESESWNLCASERLQTFYLEEKGNLKAYALIGKGKDLRSICHEIIAIDQNYLLQLAFQLPPNTIFLLSEKVYKKFPNFQKATQGIQALAKNSVLTDWIYGLDSC